MPDASHYLPLAVFAFSNIMAPGPNNIIIATSCVNFGFRRTIPCILGVGLGFLPMCFVVVAGLGNVIAAHPLVHRLFLWASFAFILYICWQLVRSRIEMEAGGARPPSFAKMVLFQWINPKAWAFSVVGTTFVVSGPSVAQQALVIALVFWAAGIPCQLVWASSGMALGGYLRAKPLRLRIFNATMVVLMMGAFVPILLG